MLKQLLSLLATLHLSTATLFNHEIDYTLLYNYGEMGYGAFIKTFLINDDTTYCPQNVIPFHNDNEEAGLPIYSYNKPSFLKVKATKGADGVNPKCPNFLTIVDSATNINIATQTIMYNNKTDVFNVGFFKPLVSNVNITSDAVNDLRIDNTFQAT